MNEGKKALFRRVGRKKKDAVGTPARESTEEGKEVMDFINEQESSREDEGVLKDLVTRDDPEDNGYVTDDDFIDPGLNNSKSELKSTSPPATSLKNDVTPEDLEDDISIFTSKDSLETDGIKIPSAEDIEKSIEDQGEGASIESISVDDIKVGSDDDLEIDSSIKSNEEPVKKPAGKTVEKPVKEAVETPAKTPVKKQVRKRAPNKKKSGGTNMSENPLIKSLAKSLVDSAVESKITTNDLEFEELKFIWDNIKDLIEDNM